MLQEIQDLRAAQGKTNKFKEKIEQKTELYNELNSNQKKLENKAELKDVEETVKSKYRPEEVDAYFKVDSMRDALRKVWEKATPKEDAHKDDEEPKKKNGKTMTGKKMDDVQVNMPEKKVGKKELPH